MLGSSARPKSFSFCSCSASTIPNSTRFQTRDLCIVVMLKIPEFLRYMDCIWQTRRSLV